MKLLELPIVFFIFLLFISSEGYSQVKGKYLQQEQQISNCLEKLYSNKKLKIEELRSVFEDYFIENKYIDSSDPIHKQYYDLLKFIEKDSIFEPFYNYNQILKLRDQLNFSRDDIRFSRHLDCFTDIYIAHSRGADTTTSFWTFGGSFEFMRTQPDISPYILAGTFIYFMDPEDLKKQLYRDIIVLTFAFTMAQLFEDMVPVIKR